MVSTNFKLNHLYSKLFKVIYYLFVKYILTGEELNIYLLSGNILIYLLVTIAYIYILSTVHVLFGIC